MYFNTFGHLKLMDRGIVSHSIRIMNRSDHTLVEFMQYYTNNCPAVRGEAYRLAMDLGYQLNAKRPEVLAVAPG